MSETSDSSDLSATSDSNEPQTPPPAQAPTAPVTPQPPQAAQPAPSQPAQAAQSAPQPRPSTLRRGSVSSIHYMLSYLALNTERGPEGAIVLLHDLPGGAFIWEPLGAAMAATGRAVYAFDLLGFGQSDKPWPADTSIWGHADCLMYALRTLGLSDITLVGFGLGGGVAQVLATRLAREQVARLALINSYAYEHAFAPNWPFPDMEKHHDPELAHSMNVQEEQEELRKTLAAGAVGGLSDARVNSYLGEWNSDLGKNVIMQQVRNMLPLYQNAVASDLVTLDRPLLLIWGERDQVTPLALGQRIADEARQARLEVIPGVGHLLLDEAPDRVGAALAAFAK